MTLLVLFVVNGLLVLAGIWYTCKTKKGKNELQWRDASVSQMQTTMKHSALHNGHFLWKL